MPFQWEKVKLPPLRQEVRDKLASEWDKKVKAKHGKS